MEVWEEARNRLQPIQRYTALLRIFFQRLALEVAELMLNAVQCRNEHRRIIRELFRGHSSSLELLSCQSTTYSRKRFRASHLKRGDFNERKNVKARRVYQRPGRACSPNRAVALVLRHATDKKKDMPEETVWRGTSSQWKNIGTFILCAVVAVLLICFSAILSRLANSQIAAIAPFLLLLLVIPIGFALARFIITRSRVFELTNERIKITEGVFSKVTDTLELYRVKDIETRQPFLYRMFKVENISITTSDTSSPLVFLEAIPSAVSFADKIRNRVEAVRMEKRVREIDIE